MSETNQHSAEEAASSPRIVGKEDFSLLLDPRVNLCSGKLVGFEVLLRWQPPQANHLTPADYLARAEHLVLAHAVACWIVEQSLALLHTLEQEGNHGMHMAIHVPMGLLADTQFSEFLKESLRRHSISGNQVELNCAEHDLELATDPVLAQLAALRLQGISIALNDFDGSHLKLRNLARWPLDSLRFNLESMGNVLSHHPDAQVARISCDLAHALKLRPIVVGVSTEGQFNFFRGLQCEMAQGSFFSPPVTCEPGLSMPSLSSLAAPHDGAPPQHLLLLDDEPNILRSLRRVLRAYPYTVHVASTPDEAFELLARHPVGVVISDQRMPLMRGTEFLARVKQMYPHTVRIVLSGYTELQSITEAINEGAIYKFLTKPWNDMELAEEIEQAFRHHQMMVESMRLQDSLRESNQQLEQQLRHNEERLLREGTALDVSYEALNVVPVPILGVDSQGMIALSNMAADQLLRKGDTLAGLHASDILPSIVTPQGDIRMQVLELGGDLYDVTCNTLGSSSQGCGAMITLLNKRPVQP